MHQQGKVNKENKTKQKRNRATTAMSHSTATQLFCFRNLSRLSHFPSFILVLACLVWFSFSFPSFDPLSFPIASSVYRTHPPSFSYLLFGMSCTRSVISICVKRGRNLPGTAHSAPFVTLEYHGQQVRCRSGESTNPVWDQCFELDVTRKDMPVYVWVYDAAVSADNTIAGGYAFT